MSEKSSRTLLLCFIHGFKGTDDTFHHFPDDLKRLVAKQLPDHKVESVVYPKYETTGELSVATEAFLAWLRERVMEIRKANSDTPWPPHDRDVGVVLVAHSMGGFVAADTLFLAINEREAGENKEAPIFPLIQGILAFDTPYNGLARSMFVYGAFSNYQKVSSVFNAMAALSAAAPASLARLGARRAATSTVASASTSSAPAWKTWQLVAARTGTIGAIAAGGVAAYVHREKIIRSVKSMRNLNKESVAEGYRQSVDAVGQGLAYINRGNVGKSFAWLSDHFTFVGALLKQNELSRRLARMAALQGVGICDFYASLGENGSWSGGYFVPERTFCAVPTEDAAANALFSRSVIATSEDEIQAHLSMFQPDKHEGYERLTEDAATLVKGWFLSDADIIDDPKFREKPAEEKEEEKEVKETLEKGADAATDAAAEGGEESAGDGLPDESPIDIAAAASLVPLPDDGKGELVGDAEGLEGDRTYMQYLFGVAQQTGTGLKGFWPAKVPALGATSKSTASKISMPSMPSMPAMPAMPSMPSVSLPSTKFFSKKGTSNEKQDAAPAEETQVTQEDEKKDVQEEQKPAEEQQVTQEEKQPEKDDKQAADTEEKQSASG